MNEVIEKKLDEIILMVKRSWEGTKESPFDCQTCGGSGEDLTHEKHGEGDWVKPCPDCERRKEKRRGDNEFRGVVNSTDGDGDPEETKVFRRWGTPLWIPENRDGKERREKS